tara:strand:+ start:10572 stop:10889 length:318 start_codon:yes stop_codon:yes gene_type:complete
MTKKPIMTRYTDDFVKKILYDKHCGMTIPTICKVYKISRPTANYLVYSRGKNFTLDDYSPDFGSFNNKDTKQAPLDHVPVISSEPPSIFKKIWLYLKSMVYRKKD